MTVGKEIELLNLVRKQLRELEAKLRRGEVADTAESLHELARLRRREKTILLSTEQPVPAKLLEDEGVAAGAGLKSTGKWREGIESKINTVAARLGVEKLDSEGTRLLKLKQVDRANIPRESSLRDFSGVIYEGQLVRKGTIVGNVTWCLHDVEGRLMIVQELRWQPGLSVFELPKPELSEAEITTSCAEIFGHVLPESEYTFVTRVSPEGPVEHGLLMSLGAGDPAAVKSFWSKLCFADYGPYADQNRVNFVDATKTVLKDAIKANKPALRNMLEMVDGGELANVSLGEIRGMWEEGRRILSSSNFHFIVNRKS